MDSEEEARAALRRFVAVGEVERWIAAQPWEPAPGGWRVLGELHGWRFRVEPVPAGVRVALVAREGDPAEWIVPG